MANHDPGQVFSPGGSQETAVPPAAPPAEHDVNHSNSNETTSFVQTNLPEKAPSDMDQNNLESINEQETAPASSPVSQPEVFVSNTPSAEAVPQPYQPEQMANFAPLANAPEPVFAEQVPQPVVGHDDELMPGPYALQDDDVNPQPSNDEVITWTASEYIAHHKTITWYVVLAGVTAVLAALIYFMTSGDLLSVAVVVLIMVVFGMYAARKPVEQEYTVSQVGIAIGQKGYPYNELKSFAVIDEGPFSSIVFMPMKRFMPALTMYYDPQDEERIFSMLSSHLPNEQNGHDRIDRLMRKFVFKQHIQ